MKECHVKKQVLISDTGNVPRLCHSDFHKQGNLITQVAPQAAFLDQFYADNPAYRCLRQNNEPLSVTDEPCQRTFSSFTNESISSLLKPLGAGTKKYGMKSVTLARTLCPPWMNSKQCNGEMSCQPLDNTCVTPHMRIRAPA